MRVVGGDERDVQNGDWGSVADDGPEAADVSCMVSFSSLLLGSLMMTAVVIDGFLSENDLETGYDWRLGMKMVVESQNREESEAFERSFLASLSKK